jgi:hypothetical protein
MTLDHLTDYVSKNLYSGNFRSFLYLEKKGGGSEVGELART